MTDLWSGLELRHLETLRAIARTGSFHAAAEELDYTQSSVSQQLAALEAVVGLRLVDRGRGRRRIDLTEAGRMLLVHADAIAARLSAARADLREYAAGASGTLRVGMYQSVGARILPAVISRFAAEWPGVEVQLRETNEDVSLVETGDIDLAFTVLPLPDGPFACSELLRDPFVLLTASGSPLARRDPPPGLAEIAAEPLIGFSPCPSMAIAEGTFRANGLEPRFVFRTDDNGTVQGLVAAGFGAAIVPVLILDADDPRVTVRPVDIPPRTITLVWHRDRQRSPAAEAFVALAQEVSAGIAGGVGPGRPG
jgi:molybdate transport repressor ModE-like protein